MPYPSTCRSFPIFDVNDPAASVTTRTMHERAAIIHATVTPNDPLPPELAAAGYCRWVNDAGSVRVLRSEPSLSGPWRDEPIIAASEA